MRSCVKLEKTAFFRKSFVCFVEARDFVTRSSDFGRIVSKNDFLRAARNHYFYSGFGSSHRHGSWRCAWNHCKNRGFRHTRRERETGRTQKGGQNQNQDMFWGAMPETTVFTVVSGVHTGVVLAHVPQTTIKIVVSGTWGVGDKQALVKKTATSRQERLLGLPRVNRRCRETRT